MAVAGMVAGDPDHILIGVVPDNVDPESTLSVWIGRDAVTNITLSAAESLAEILLGAIEVARGEASLALVVDERQMATGDAGAPS